jgi:hypothetical protein
MTSQEAFEELFGMAAESNSYRFSDFDTGWQASRAALIAEIKAGGWISYGGDKHYRLPDEDCSTG